MVYRSQGITLIELLVVMTIVGSAMPTLRALRVNPITAIRVE